MSVGRGHVYGIVAVFLVAAIVVTSRLSDTVTTAQVSPLPTPGGQPTYLVDVEELFYEFLWVECLRERGNAHAEDCRRTVKAMHSLDWYRTGPYELGSWRD